MSYQVSVQEAREIIKSEISFTEIIKVPLLAALDRYTAEAIYASIDVPSFDNAAMDGYGICFEDLQSHKYLQVKNIVQAGAKSGEIVLERGEAVRIFTGAPIPSSVDTVVPQEYVLRKDDLISFGDHQIYQGDHIRNRGSQSKKGDCVLPVNTYVNHAVVGFLAGFGITHVTVYQPLKTSILCTGNELVEIGNPLSEGQIFNSNAYTLEAALSEIKQCLVTTECVADRFEAVRDAIQNLLAQDVDVLLITGGISVGDYDYVGAALEGLGATQLFYKVKQKPGKPLYFGKLGKQYIFALPGNPASVFSCYHHYIKPFLLGCMGRVNFDENADHAVCTNPARKKYIEQTQLLKAFVTGQTVRILEGQESYKMNAVALANCFVEFPAGSTTIKANDTVKIWKI